MKSRENHQKPVYWEELTWEEIPVSLREADDAVLWPFGATEQHGPHLGTGVDSFIAAAVCSAVSARTGVPALPVIPVGCSLGHTRKWPGTLSLRPRTMIAMIAEIGAWLHAAGVRRLFLVNAHVTNFAPMRCALEELRFDFPDLQIALINTAEISPRVHQRFSAEGPDWHANEAETALMLALQPSATRADRFSVADDPDRTPALQFAHPVSQTSKNGVTGSPSTASLEKGQELFEWMVADLSDRVLAGCGECPPFPPQAEF